MIIQQHAQHAVNLAAILVPVTSWMAHADVFFTATAGFCGTAWYVLYFAREFLKWRKKRHEGK